MTKLASIGTVYVRFGETLKDSAARLFMKGLEYLKTEWEGEYYTDGNFAVHGDNYRLFNEVKS